MNKYLKRVLKILGITVGSIIAIVLIFVLVLTIAEYRPDDVERLIRFRNNPSDESWIGMKA